MNKRVLAWVNKQRAEYGIGDPLDAMPKGRRHHGGTCPVAEALCVHDPDSPIRWVARTCMELEPEGPDGEIPTRRIPDYVSRAITRFDGGAYPHLLVGDDS